MSLASIQHDIQSSGAWGVAVSIALMVLHSFIPFPAEFVAIANGMIYGVVWGIVVTWFGAMIGAMLAFGLARWLGQPFISRLLKDEQRQVMKKWLAKKGAAALLVSRFIPVISFNLINYAAGLSQISWWTFIWSTGLGILPMTALMVSMGDRIRTLPWEVWGWGFLILAGILLWLLIAFLSNGTRGFPPGEGGSR
jgi:uncharacterized membrane protein YdjX (TVP38/TMEM64 family)